MKRGINNMVKFELRKALCNLYRGLCAYCGRHIGMRGTVDHYVPKALGGTNERSNLRWCCFECNRDKADMPPEEWQQRIPQRRAAETKSQRRIALLSSIAQHRRAA